MIRSAEAFQTFPRVDCLVLDKTGTVTKGKFQVTDLFPLQGSPERLIFLAASAEVLSEHPLAQAIVSYTKNKNIGFTQPQKFKVFSGRGVLAVVDGEEILVGKPSFLQEQGVRFPMDTGRVLNRLAERGETVVGVASNKTFLGLIALGDSLKEDARQTVTKLRQRGMEPVMITGDNQQTARAIAEEVGIDRFFARVLPDKKAEKIRDLQREGRRVAMVGDGINDAPALMQADVGIALGTGTDIAVESSDIIIMSGSLQGILQAHDIARESYSKTKQNLWLAFIFNGIGVPAATTGLVHPVWAMIAMVASVTTVLLNSFGSSLFQTTKTNTP